MRHAVWPAENQFNSMTYDFIATEHLSLENSFGTIKEASGPLRVRVGIHENVVGIDENGQSEIEYSGWFELCDVATEGEDWYAEGELSFAGKELVDYDGVFALPQCVCDCLRQHGFDPSYAED